MLGERLKPSLDIVRAHLRKRDIDYCWLDILCLRQEGGIQEQQRSLEWETDVPTIGNIYRNAVIIVRYLNGLGKELVNHRGAWADERHWINRAWTLQEIKPDDQMSTPDGDKELNLLQTVRDTNPPQSIHQLLHPVSQLAATAHSPKGCRIIPLVRQIVGRSASSALDKVAGINYLMWPAGSRFDVPIYKTMSIDSAWLKCVYSMRLELKLELLFLYPNPRTDPTNRNIIRDYIWGLGERSIKNLPPYIWQKVLRNDCPQWIPSWAQLNDFTTDSVWDKLGLPNLPDLRLSYTEHPLQVPIYMSNLKTPFGAFVLDGCRMVLESGSSLHGESKYKRWEIFGSICFTGYSPIDTVFVPKDYPYSSLGFEHGFEFQPWAEYYLLGLSLDTQAPWLVCRAIMDAMFVDSGWRNFAGVSSIAAGITAYPRTLILQKEAVLWTDDRLRLARKFPQTMPWPERKYDAIYIL